MSAIVFALSFLSYLIALVLMKIENLSFTQFAIASLFAIGNTTYMIYKVAKWLSIEARYMIIVAILQAAIYTGFIVLKGREFPAVTFPVGLCSSFLTILILFYKESLRKKCII